IALGGSSLGGALALDVADRREHGFVQAAFGWSGGYDLSALAQASFGWSQLIATYLTGCPLVAFAERYAYASAVRFGDRGDQQAHYGPAGAHVMDVYPPARSTPAPAVVFVHSAATDRAEWAAAARVVAGLGFVGITIDYRISAPWPGTLDDVEAAVQYVRSQA